MRNFTQFKCLLQTSGLHIDEACVFLNASKHTIRKYISDGSLNSEWACLLLMDLISKQDRVLNDLIRRHEPIFGQMSLKIPSDNREAELLGLPTVSSYQPIIGYFMAYAKKKNKDATFVFIT